MTGSRSRLGAVTEELGERARQLEGDVETQLASVLTATGVREVRAALKPTLDSFAGKAKEVESGLDDLDKELTRTQQDIRGVARAITTSFPIGWNRFPACLESDAPDLRCGGAVFTKAKVEGGWWQEFEGWLIEPFQTLWSPVSLVITGMHEWPGLLRDARTQDPADYWQWLAGILLTGLLLGLGTPFWVQVVSTGFSLRRWVTKEQGSEAEGAKAQAAPMTVVAPINGLDPAAFAAAMGLPAPAASATVASGSSPAPAAADSAPASGSGGAPAPADGNQEVPDSGKPES